MKTETIEYACGDATLEGYLAYDDSHTEKRPAVLISHAWAGRDQFVCDKAVQLAELGYTAFAIDNYGKGKLGTNPEENQALMMPLIEDRALLRLRLLTSFDQIKTLPYVDSSKIAAIGFCFGGLCVLDLARSGADIAGVVSFHGLLNAPEKLANEKIRAKVLALHGHDDPMVPPEQVLTFQQEMTEAGADWQMHVYGKTQHAFTNPEANDASMGTIYNPVAQKRSWQAMQNFFAEIFA